jgi:hypothetical protein
LTTGQLSAATIVGGLQRLLHRGAAMGNARGSAGRLSAALMPATAMSHTRREIDATGEFEILSVGPRVAHAHQKAMTNS